MGRESNMTNKTMLRASIRGDEVAVAKALRDGTYHECPWKTWEQLWYDVQQIEKEDKAQLLGIIRHDEEI